MRLIAQTDKQIDILERELEKLRERRMAKVEQLTIRIERLKKTKDVLLGPDNDIDVKHRLKALRKARAIMAALTGESAPA